MLTKADGIPRTAWALKHVRTGEIATCTLVETELQARELLVGYGKHLPHLGKHVVVPVTLAVAKA